jgi:hypothetical protein
MNNRWSLWMFALSAALAVAGLVTEKPVSLRDLSGATIKANHMCSTTPVPGWSHECACETGSTVFSCEASWTVPITKYFCLAGGTLDCSEPTTSCGEKRNCGQTLCNSSSRSCALTGINCSGPSYKCVEI